MRYPRTIKTIPVAVFALIAAFGAFDFEQGQLLVSFGDFKLLQCLAAVVLFIALYGTFHPNLSAANLSVPLSVLLLVGMVFGASMLTPDFAGQVSVGTLLFLGTWLVFLFLYVDKGTLSLGLKTLGGDQVAKDALNGTSLAGEAKHVETVVMFSDARGFTSFSEQCKPREILQILNVHFDDIGKEIVRHHGEVDKFIGDAVMAYWLADGPTLNKESLALQTALDTLSGMPEVKKRLKTMGIKLDDFEIGIGLHCGEAVAGYTGFQGRVNYTLVGDTVNLASRIEGLTKFYETAILFTDRVYHKLDDAMQQDCFPVDKVIVKGKSTPIIIYSHHDAVRHAPNLNAEAARIITSAFVAYSRKEFDRALELYRHSGYVRLVEIFSDRINDKSFRQRAKTHRWLGEYEHLTK